MLHTDLAKELVIEPKAVEFALGQEVRDLGNTSLWMLAEMPDERMLALVVLEGARAVSRDKPGGMHDTSGELTTKAELGVRDELDRNDFRDRTEHVVTEGVEIVERTDLCYALNESPNVSMG